MNSLQAQRGRESPGPVLDLAERQRGRLEGDVLGQGLANLALVGPQDFLKLLTKKS